MSDEQLDINAVLEFYGARIKTRRTYMTNCVFHDDRKPSLSVNTERGLFKCQSCGQGGDGYSLIMLKEDCDFRRASELAAALGITTGDTGGSDSAVPSGYLSRRSAPPPRKGDRPRYRPAFSRRGSD